MSERGTAVIRPERRRSQPMIRIIAEVALGALLALALIAPVSVVVAVIALVTLVLVVLAISAELSSITFDATTAITGMLLLLFLIPAPEAVGYLGGTGTPAMIACVCLGLTWLGASLRYIPALRSRCTPLRAAGLMLGAVGVASWVIASTRRITSEEVRASDRGLLVLFAMLGLMLFTAELMRSRERLYLTIDRLILGATALAIIGIIQFNIHLDVVRLIHVPGLRVVNTGFIEVGTRSKFARVAGTTLHPIEFGYVLAVVFPLALHRAFYPPAERSRLARWAPAALMAVAILMSLSRTAGIGIAVAGLILVPSWPKVRRRRTYVIVPLFLAATRIVIPGLVGTMFALFTSVGQDTSVSARTARYSVADAFIRNAPILGRGIKTLVPPLVFDNQYLETLIETGILGLLALIGIFLTGIALTRFIRHASTDPRTRDLAQTLCACIAIPLLTYATWDAMSFPVGLIVTYLTIGMAGALWRLEGGPTPWNDVGEPRAVKADAEPPAGAPPLTLVTPSTASA